MSLVKVREKIQRDIEIECNNLSVIKKSYNDYMNALDKNYPISLISEIYEKDIRERTQYIEGLKKALSFLEESNEF